MQMIEIYCSSKYVSNTKLQSQEQELKYYKLRIMISVELLFIQQRASSSNKRSSTQDGEREHMPLKEEYGR
jgi:hypothetical protein